MAKQERIGLEAVLVTTQFQKGLQQYLKGQKAIQASTKKTATSGQKSTNLLQKSFVALGAKLAAIGIAAKAGQALIQFSVDSFQAAASAERLGNATENLGKRFGISGEQIVSSIQEASGFTISRLDAMRQANQAMLLGVAQNEGQFARMTQIAVTLGRAMGQSATKSVEDLTLALGRQSPLILDNLGINLKLSEANEAMAASLGKTVSQLTDAEKKTGFMEEALRKGEEAMVQIGGVTQDTGANIEEVTARFSDFQVALGSFLTQAADSSGTFDVVTDGLESWTFILGDAIPTIQAANEAIELSQSAMDVQAGAALVSAQNIEQMREATENASNSVLDIRTGIISASSSFDEYNTTADRLANVNADADQSFNALIFSLNITEKEFNAVRAATEQERVAQEKANVARAKSAQTLRLEGLAAQFATQNIEEEVVVVNELSKELQASVLLGSEFLSVQDKIAVTTARSSEQIAVQSARLSGLAASFGAAADFSRITPQEAQEFQEERQEEAKVEFDTSGIESGINDALQSIKSAVGQISGLTFSEILPPGETFRVDEWARRMQAVVNDGSNQFAQGAVEAFAGEKFIQPLADAVATGDPQAISDAAASIINGPDLFELMDIDGAIEQAEGLLAEQNLQQRINDAIVAGVAGSGDVPVSDGVGGQTLLNAIGLGEGADPATPITEAVTGLDIPTLINEALAIGEGESPLLALFGLGEGGSFNEAISILTGETLPLLGKAFAFQLTDARLKFEILLLAIQNVDMALTTMSTTTLPNLSSSVTTTAGVFLTKFKKIDEKINASTEIVRNLERAVGSDFVKAADKAKGAVERWISSLRTAAELVTGLSAGGGEGEGAGRGLGLRHGIGFANGTSPLGFRIPAGFPNDTFPINVTSGERVVVSPPGKSIEQVTGLGTGPSISININGVNITNGMDLNMFEGRVTRAVTQGMAG